VFGDQLRSLVVLSLHRGTVDRADGLSSFSDLLGRGSMEKRGIEFSNGDRPGVIFDRKKAIIPT
jgi:hypothetical protein